MKLTSSAPPTPLPTTPAPGTVASNAPGTEAAEDELPPPPPPAPLSNPLEADDLPLVADLPFEDVEPELEPAYEDFHPPLTHDMLRQKFSAYHCYMLSHTMQEATNREILRRRLEQWVAWVANRQRREQLFRAHGRGAHVVFSLAAMLALWRRYHKWRLWLGLRRTNPKEFGLIPRALVYDPAEPEIGDVETIKERITYHSREVEEMSGVLQRHHDILDLLRDALQKKLAEEMASLHRMSEQLESERVRWADGTPEEVELRTARNTAVSPPPPAHPAPTTHSIAVGSPGGVIVHASAEPLIEADTFTTPLQGYISRGGDLKRGPKWMTIEDARSAARLDPDCNGFTYSLKNTASDGRVLVYFKNKCDVHTHAVGWRSYTRFNANLGEGDVRPSVGLPLPPATPQSLRDPRASPPLASPGNGYLKDPSEIIRKIGVSALLRRRLLDFYQYHNPGKLPSVMHTLLEFKGHEEALFEALVMQYGPEPQEEHMNKSLPPGYVVYVIEG